LVAEADIDDFDVGIDGDFEFGVFEGDDVHLGGFVVGAPGGDENLGPFGGGLTV
jgi:hypothetical protein